MNDYKPPTLRLRWGRFLGGVGWSAMVAALLSELTDAPFAPLFAVCLAGMLVAASLGLAWMTIWARRRQSLPGQFTIGSLFFATCFVALYFAAVRWVGFKLMLRDGMHSDGAVLYIPAALLCGLIALISIPIAFGMLEAVLRAGIWSLRQPIVRASLKGLRRLRG